MGGSLEHYPFPGSVHSAGELPFVGSDERTLVYLKSSLGSSRIASPAYQKWPT
eukprot:gene7459-gene1081